MAAAAPRDEHGDVDRPLITAVRSGAPLAAAALGLGMLLAPAADAASEQWFYGRTSARQAASIDLIGGATAGSAGARANWQSRQFLMAPGVVEHPLPGGLHFRRGRLSVHRRVAGPVGTEFWLSARLQGGGRRIAGTYHELVRAAGYPTIETRIAFRTVLWASSGGAEWVGSTADGQPLGLSVVSLSAPPPSRRRDSDAPRLLVRVPSVARTLRCEPADGGAPFDTSATVRDLTAPLAGAPPVDGGFAFTSGLRTAPGQPARASVVTLQGVSVSADLAITHLRQEAGGLRATGTLGLRGTIAGGSCEPIATSFTLRPR